MGKGKVPGEFEQVVLLALAAGDGEVDGKSVYEQIVRTTGREASVAAVYVTLARLEKKGHVASRKGEPTPERGGRAKKYFRLETAGAAAIMKSRQQLDSLWESAKAHPRLRGS
ncbi:MAG: PadR family transcriptional regulator [Acidobacteriota bacterium]